MMKTHIKLHKDHNEIIADFSFAANSFHEVLPSHVLDNSGQRTTVYGQNYFYIT